MVQGFFWFCWKPYRLFRVLIFAPIRSSPSLETRSPLPWDYIKSSYTATIINQKVQVCTVFAEISTNSIEINCSNLPSLPVYVKHPHPIVITSYQGNLSGYIPNLPFMTLGLIYLRKGFRRAYKRRGLHPRGLITGIEKVR